MQEIRAKRPIIVLTWIALLTYLIYDCIYCYSLLRSEFYFINFVYFALNLLPLAPPVIFLIYMHNINFRKKHLFTVFFVLLLVLMVFTLIWNGIVIGFHNYEGWIDAITIFLTGVRYKTYNYTLVDIFLMVTTILAKYLILAALFSVANGNTNRKLSVYTLSGVILSLIYRTIYSGVYIYYIIYFLDLFSYAIFLTALLLFCLSNRTLNLVLRGKKKNGTLTVKEELELINEDCELGYISEDEQKARRTEVLARL